jgi:hypothetical protein
MKHMAICRVFGKKDHAYNTWLHGTLEDNIPYIEKNPNVYLVEYAPVRKLHAVLVTTTEIITND